MTTGPEQMEAEDTGRGGVLRLVGDYIDWKVNPVLVRDLRLYARGRKLPLAYLLVLGSLVLVAIGYAISADRDHADGQWLLSFINSFLAVACGAVIPNLVYERFRSELAGRATELTLMSPLTPRRLVAGKLGAAWCVSMLLISVAAPMIMTAYLLGGVNAVSIAGSVLSLSLAACVNPLVQLFLATRGGGRGIFRVIAGFVFLGQVVGMVAYASLVNAAFVHGTLAGEWRFAGLASTYVGMILIGQFLFFVTVGRLRGESENREAAPRASLAFAAYAGGALALYLSRGLSAFAYATGLWVSLADEAALVGCVVCWAFCIGYFIICRSNPVLPRNLAVPAKRRRLLGFLFRPGLRSLVGYFMANAVVILFITLLPFNLDRLGLDVGVDISGFAARMSCLGLAPFFAIATGLAAHYYIALPLSRERRNPGLLQFAVLAANIVLGVTAFFVIVTAGLGGFDETSVVVGVTPVGLIAASMSSAVDAENCVEVGQIAFGVLMLLLAPALVRNKAEAEPARRDAADAAEEEDTETDDAP